MNKTQELLAKIAAGTHRINEYNHVLRWVESRKEWMTSHAYRKDVILRAAVQLKYGV